MIRKPRSHVRILIYRTWLFLKTRHKGPEYTYGHSYVHRLGNQADIDTYTSPQYLYNQRFRHSYFWTNYTRLYLKQKESWHAIFINSNRFSINMHTVLNE